MRRRTKIICTIGPATGTPERIELLIRAGMDIARLNFSHGDHAYHRQNYELIRDTAKRLGANVAIMMDLQGPKIRTGTLHERELVELVDGEEFTITTEDVPGTARRVSTSYANLPHDVKPGDRILIADGTLEVEVCRVAAPEIECLVVRGGMLGHHKGLNLPGVRIAERSLTAKDEEDLAFGLGLGVDFIALSFVRSPDDIRYMRERMVDLGGNAAVIAKIERPEALECFEEILALSDAIMVARGDLGVEVDFEEVPMIQKRLIRCCNEHGVPVITATQMLESMMTHSRPTRAEVTDVANAIYDGTDAIMLSGETAAGDHPIGACATMAKIAFKADEELVGRGGLERWSRARAADFMQRASTMQRHNLYVDVIGFAVRRMAEELQINRIVCFTTTGYTAAAISRHRPSAKITAITNTVESQRRCAILWGVHAVVTDDFHQIDDMIQRVEKLLLDNQMVVRGDTIIIVAGTPLRVGGRTNLLKLHTIGEEL